MIPAERFKKWIEGLAESWKDRLRGWMASWAAKGAEELLDHFEPELVDQARAHITALRDNPATPAELKVLLDKALTPSSFAIVPILVGIIIATVMSGIVSGLTPAFKKITYQSDQVAESARLEPFTAIRARWRELISEEHLDSTLKDLGWSDTDIQALKDVALFYPPPADLVRWQAREVFEPDMITKYGLDDELEGIQRGPFYKAGMTEEQITNYWRAHWEHASWMQIVEMLHRGLIEEADVWDWFRLVEIPPFWRQHLIDSAYAWPTRVDVRRWWDMRTIDEPELRRLYSGMGYRGVNLDNYVLWTKVYVAFPDLMARWSKGWITIDDVRSELTALGMPAERLEEFIQMKVKAEQPERTAKERDVTKTDIIKGVKTGVITRGEGEELLVDMGYSYDEAVYILEINIPRDQEDEVVKERELSKTDIRAGIAKEILSREGARTKLLELRYRPADVEFLLDIYEVVAKPPPEPRVREASKADIVLGVKKGLITQYEGYGMLLDLDFTPEAASFILTVRTEESPFSPINYAEFKDLTAKYKIATGREEKPMTEELKKAADMVVKLTTEVESLARSVEKEKRGLVKEEVLPAETTERLTELQVKLHRAEAELARVKSEYDRLLAEWRHGKP